MPGREGNSPGNPFELGEDPITALVPQRHERIGEQVIINHNVASSNDRLGIEPASASS
jgi:hypothetical protein